jgi:hypothetical protein
VLDRQASGSTPAAAFSSALRAICVLALLLGGGVPAYAGGQSTGRGTIKGHVRLTGDIPGNPVIRMRRDPMCAKATAGKQVVEETVVANLKGDLANVFVKVVGSFPAGPAPTTTVTIDQHGCVYAPRVVGVQVGQPLQIRNSDDLLHNVHSSSTVKDNSFNIGQPIKGMMNQFRLKDEDSMVRVACDVHGWMTAWVGVVNHPYFAVSDRTGAFEIANVPPGTYTIQAWHERYGVVTQNIAIRAGAATTVAFTYVDKGTPAPPSKR